MLARSHRLGALVSRRVLSIVGALALAGAVTVLPNVAGGSISGHATALTPVTSQISLQQALQKALTAKSLPANLTPSLIQLAGGASHFAGSSYEHANCNPYVYPSEAAHPQPCWYGSKIATAPVIVIFGDSFVGNWIPALDLIGQHLKYRVADFEFDSCITPFVDTIGGPVVIPVAPACATWHAQLAGSVVPLHPKAIIAANGSSSWGSADTSWLAGMKTAFTKLNPKGTSVQILLGTGPHLSTPSPACLSAYSSNLQHCTFHYSSTSEFQKALNRDAQAASTVGVHVVKTFQWVCLSRACPMAVASATVFVDSDHLSVVYSKYLYLLLQSSLKPLLSL